MALALQESDIVGNGSEIGVELSLEEGLLEEVIIFQALCNKM